jgi:DNA gyrase subunit A
MEIIQPGNSLLLVTRQGFGKRVPVWRFTPQARAGLGVRAFQTGPMTGPVADARVVNDGGDDEVMLVSAGCQVFRTSIREIPVQGRITRGVIVWRPDGDDEVASIACLRDKGTDSYVNGTGQNGQGKAKAIGDEGDDGEEEEQAEAEVIAGEGDDGEEEGQAELDI